jgi:pimeloyl-ACP methyl ester carboxylesterase
MKRRELIAVLGSCLVWPFAAPDMRGFGASTPMPREYPWTLDGLIDEFRRLMDALGVERFHLIGAKIGGTIARAFVARRPARVRTLTVVGTPTPLRVGAAENAPALAEAFETRGVEPWTRESMAGRLGSSFETARPRDLRNRLSCVIDIR